MNLNNLLIKIHGLGLLYKAVICFIAGCLATLSFAPFYMASTQIISIASLYLVLSDTQASVKHNFLFALSYAFGLFVASVSWVYVSIHTYGNASVLVSLIITVTWVLALSLVYFAWFFPLWCKYLLSINHACINILSFAGLWVLMEWFRSWFLTGFPWSYVGYSQTDSVLSGYAAFGGVYLLSFIVVATSALVIECVRDCKNKNLLFMAVILVCSWILGLFIGNNNIKETTKLKVALLQGNVDQAVKFTVESIREQLSFYATKTTENPDKDIVVWPETAVALYADRVTEYLDELRLFGIVTQTTILTGIPTRIQNERSNNNFNSILALGVSNGSYDKQKLVPFGEFVPFANVLRGLIEFFDLPFSSFSKGQSKQEPIVHEQTVITPLICYEVAYPDFVRDMSLNKTSIEQSQILVTVSNDAWFGSSIGPHQHLQIARMRAIETNKWMLRSTNNGITAIIDNNGLVVDDLKQFSQDLLTGVVHANNSITLFMQYGSAPILLLSALLCVIAYFYKLTYKH